MRNGTEKPKKKMTGKLDKWRITREKEKVDLFGATEIKECLSTKRATSHLQRVDLLTQKVNRRANLSHQCPDKDVTRPHKHTAKTKGSVQAAV